MRRLLVLLVLTFVASPALAQRYTSTSISGVGEGDRFGQQVLAGNLNGGASDLLVVSESGMATSTLRDREVHVFYGRVGFPREGLTADDADLVLRDSETDADFGADVAVGDLNGDGFGDVVVGVPYNNDRVDESGAVYVYCGGATPDATRDRVLYGRLTLDNNPDQPGVADEGYNLGQQVGTGDVNGDGFDDVVVGGFSSGDGDHEYHVFLGNAGFCSGPPINAEDSDGTVRIEPGAATATGDLAVGDVNGDIYADIVLVDTYDWYHPSADRSGGAVFAFHGAASLPALQTVATVDGPNDADAVVLLFDPSGVPGDPSPTVFSPSVAVGDLDGDGVGDIAAIAERAISVDVIASVHVFDGASLPTFSVRAEGDFRRSLGQSLGARVAIGDAGALGEVTSEAQADLLVGGFQQVEGEFFANVRLLFGPLDVATGSAADDFSIVSPTFVERRTTAPVAIPSLTGCAGWMYGVPSTHGSAEGSVSITSCNPPFVYIIPDLELGLDRCEFQARSWARGLNLCQPGYFELAPDVLGDGDPTPMSFGGVFIEDPSSNDPENPDYIDVSKFYDIDLQPEGCSIPGCATYRLNEIGLQNPERLSDVFVEVTSPRAQVAVSIATVGFSGEAFLFEEFPLTLTPTVTEVLGSYDLYASIPGTPSPVQITSIPDRGEFNPDWAPFGPYLVHDAAAFGPGDSFLGQDLWVTNAATGASAMLPGTDGGNDAAWWPFGALIAYDRAGDPVGPDETIYLSAAWGGARVPVRTDALDPSWSPTGRFLAFHQPSDGSVRAIDLLTGRETLVAETGRNPAWSPDGRWIAYADGGDLLKVRVQPNGHPLASPVAVTSGPEQDGQPAWYPSDGRLAYQSDATGAIDLYRVAASGGSPLFVTGLAEFGDFDPAVFPSQAGIVAYAGYTRPMVTARVATESSRQLEGTALDREARSARALYAEADLELADLTASIGLDGTAGRQLDAWIAEAIGSADTEEGGNAVPAFAVSAYPNPASASATVRLELAEAAEVEVTVVDVLGRSVAHLADGPFEAGRHTAAWDVSDVPPGVYVVLVRAGEQRAMQRITVAR